MAHKTLFCQDLTNESPKTTRKSHNIKTPIKFFNVFDLYLVPD